MEETQAESGSAPTRTLPQRIRSWFGSLGSIVALLLLAWSARLAMLPLNDNSFFTHLATGRIILDRGSVPSSDPYTFTAAGESWTVQSWLASVAYAGAERLAGAVGIKLLVLVLFTISTALLWYLSRRAGSLLLRLLLVAGALAVSSAAWSERPYMIGIIGLALVWLALDGSIPAVVLVPFMWVWANTHGSFVLALALVASYGVGAWFDARLEQRRLDHRPITHTGAAVVFGSLLAVASPLGFRALLFPVNTVSRSDLLGEIVEWQAPNFDSANQLAYLVLVSAAVWALMRLRQWRYALPLLAFVMASLTSQRNIAMATVVLVPVIAAAIPPVGTLRSETKPRLGVFVAAVMTALLGLVIAGGLVLPRLGLGGYPTAAISWLGPQGLETRTATQDFTGNLIEALDGPERVVFVDDRADMFPPDVLRDFLSLARGKPEWSRILADYEIDQVVWRRADPLGSLLAADRTWRVLFSDSEWVVACRRGAACPAPPERTNG